MNKYTIKSQSDIDKFIKKINWHHAFIREAYLITPSYIEDKGVYAPDHPPDLKILITNPMNDSPGVELVFEDVENIYIPCMVDVEPIGKYERDYIEFYLYHDDNYEKNNIYNLPIRAKTMHYILLDKSCWGNKVRYGIENTFE